MIVALRGLLEVVAMDKCRRACRATITAATFLLVILAAACGSAPASSDATSTTTRAANAGGTPTTVRSSASRVLEAYRAAWAAFEHAAADANADDPELATTMVDPQLQGVKANLFADQRQGIVGRGSFTLHPKVTALTATTATVVDCAYSTAELVYANSGKPVPPITPPENDGVQSTLVLSGGSWKVSKQTVTDGKCAPGS